VWVIDSYVCCVTIFGREASTIRERSVDDIYVRSIEDIRERSMEYRDARGILIGGGTGSQGDG
jgi:FlaA1/EpsC-like NDP-sugar epimerase